MSSHVAHACAVALLTLYVACVERNRIGVTSLTTLGLLLMHGIGFWYFLYAVPGLVPSVEQRTQFLLALGSVMFIIGAEVVRWSVSATWLAQARARKGWARTPLARGGMHDHWVTAVALAIALYIFLVIVMTGKLADIATYITQPSESIRAALRRDQQSGGYVYGVLLMSLGPFFSGVVLLRAASNGGWLLRVAATALCGAVFLGRFAALTKSMWVIYLMQLFLTVFAVRGLHLPFKQAITALAVTIFALFLGSWLAFPEAPAGEIFVYLLYRIVQITNEGIYQTVYVYPDLVPFSNGLNIGLLASIAGHDVPLQAHTTVAAFFGAFGATFNTMFMSGAWVDFGWSGVAIVSLLVGASARFYDHLALSVGKSALGCALIGFSIIPADQLMATSAQTAWLSGGLLSVPLLVLAVRPALESHRNS